MSRKSLIYFLLVGFLWGIPYLLMKVAVEEIPPSAIVAGRTLIGAAILIPVALYRKTFKGAVLGFKFVAFYALLEMIGPWILISTAQKKIDSGLAGLLISTVPIFAAIITSMRGDHTVWQFKRMFGIVVGFIGLIAVVGIESFSGNSHPASIAMMILAAMGYSYAIIMVTTNLPLVDGIAINGLAMAITSIFWAPLAIAQWPSQVTLKPALSLIALGVLCTALAFLVFFKLLVEIGPARGSLVTYLNTSVAVVLGVIVLNEPITIGLIIGLPLVLIGSYLASKKTQSDIVAKP
ncbi:MAG: DMT family transporter [Streptomycetaceae bacterium]|jgi:drug/metabolite transporter (DMT)-like permease|nr:DMT family transporter [Streptomycetaceae bacterium]